MQCPIPINLVTSSSSGLDPSISVVVALYQLPRATRLRALNEPAVHTLVD